MEKIELFFDRQGKVIGAQKLGIWYLIELK